MTAYRVNLRAEVVTSYDIDAESEHGAMVAALQLGRVAIQRGGWSVDDIGIDGSVEERQ